MKPIMSISRIIKSNQDNYDSSLVDTLGNTTGYIKKHRNPNIEPYYIRVYAMNSEYHQLVNNLPNISCYKLLACIMWCLNKTLIQNSDIILLSYSIYITYTKEYNLKPISQPMYYKALKYLVNNKVIKHEIDKPRGSFKVNFKILANGKYKQEVF